MLRNAISFKLVVGTYMGEATPEYNKKNPRSWLPRSQLFKLHSLDVNQDVLDFRPEGHREPRNKVGSLSPAERLLGFESGTFQFLLQRLNPLGHSHQQFPSDFPFIQYLLDLAYKIRQYAT